MWTTYKSGCSQNNLRLNQSLSNLPNSEQVSFAPLSLRSLRFLSLFGLSASSLSPLRAPHLTTKKHGICYKPGDKINFRKYSDAYSVGNIADRKSTSGYTFMLLGAPVSWGNKKQPSVSLSTSEAEHVALSLAIQEDKWIHRLLCEIMTAAKKDRPELMILKTINRASR